MIKYDVHSKVCNECPFKKDSLRGFLGDYDGPEDFIGVHNEQPCPCHTRTDYMDPEWLNKLAAGELKLCKGQQIFLANQAKRPRGWSIRQTIERNTEDYFTFPHEFIKHHTNEELQAFLKRVRGKDS